MGFATLRQTDPQPHLLRGSLGKAVNGGNAEKLQGKSHRPGHLVCFPPQCFAKHRGVTRSSRAAWGVLSEEARPRAAGRAQRGALRRRERPERRAAGRGHGAAAARTDRKSVV